MQQPLKQACAVGTASGLFKNCYYSWLDLAFPTQSAMRLEHSAMVASTGVVVNV
jgi:hypothetical protein